MVKNKELETLEDLISSGLCVPVIGAGASIPAGAPSWGTYIDKLAVDVSSTREIDSWKSRGDSILDIAETLIERRRAGHLNRPEVTINGPSLIHKVLAAWQCPLYLTTNYDDGLEKAFTFRNRNLSVFRNDELINFHFDHVGSKLIKLCTSRSGNAITASELNAILTSQAIQDLFTILLRTHSLLFVGCGMGDPIIRGAFQRSQSSSIPLARHFAIMPKRTSPPTRTWLQKHSVEIIELSDDELTGNTVTFLEEIRPVSHATKHVLLYEPGSDERLQRTLSGLENILKQHPIGWVTLATRSPNIFGVLESWGKRQVPQIEVRTIEIPEADKDPSRAVLDAVHVIGRDIDAVFCPYELSIDEVSSFVLQYNKTNQPPLDFHSVYAVSASRRKDIYRDVLDKLLSDRANDDEFRLIGRVPSAVIEIEASDTVEQFEAKVQAIGHKIGTELVLKPVNAAGSFGVRPISLQTGAEQNCREQIVDFLRVMNSIPSSRIMSRCNSSTVLIERRIAGDEFSVEGIKVSSDSTIKTVAVHWKPGIDNSSTRFFERVYVTIPESIPEFKIMKDANSLILSKIDVSPGVFHSEFRYYEGKVYPLEFGLRPGGGMVNLQVLASHGVDLYEAGIRASMKLTPRPDEWFLKSVVASAEVFADSPGVLPPLSVSPLTLTHRRTDGKRWAVGKGQEKAAAEYLQSLICSVDRAMARGLLKRSLHQSKSPMTQRVLKAFTGDGSGLRATIDDFQIWLEPGVIVLEPESSYVAGIRIVSSAELGHFEAIAEVLAAMEVCFSSIQCRSMEPLPETKPIS